jgi:hypothetical protein
MHDVHCVWGGSAALSRECRQVSVSLLIPQASGGALHVPGVVDGELVEQTWGEVQVPHDTGFPQPSSAVPQLLVPQAAAAVFGVQPQTFGFDGVPPPQVCGDVQVPQVTAGQPVAVKVPQLSPDGQFVWQFGVHWPWAVQF